jgi:transcription termination/antitermination protein NusG
MTTLLDEASSASFQNNASDEPYEVSGSLSSGLFTGDDEDRLKPSVKVKVQASEDAGTALETSLEEGSSEVASAGAPKRRRWYILHTYSGHENKVKINLERRIESMSMGHKIFRVEVPQKPVTKIKDGKKIEKDEHMFPGYVLVEMIMDDDSWYCVRYTPGITKFVGGEKKPIPVRDSEIKRILFRGQQTMATKIEVDIKVGEHIEIVSGPFQGFEGMVTEVHAEKLKLKALVSIFGRETPVELVFSQVKKKTN